MTPTLTDYEKHSTDADSKQSTSLETGQEVDPNVPEGVIAESQPRYRCGIHYTPLGLRMVYQKKRKLNYDGIDYAQEDKK